MNIIICAVSKLSDSKLPLIILNILNIDNALQNEGSVPTRNFVLYQRNYGL